MHHCNLCGKTDFQTLLYVPDVPIGHNFRHTTETQEYIHPFHLALCDGCNLPQLLNPVPPEKLYQNEIYLTGFQKPCHLDDLIGSTAAHQSPGSVLEVGCNDGALLTALEKAGHIDVVGIEPNQHAAMMAVEAGHRVIRSMLTEDIAKTIGTFDTVYSRHVLEHVPNITEFMNSIRAVLVDDGIFVLEIPAIENALNQGNPAILWEEHVNYFTLEFAQKLLAYFGFEILEKRQYLFGGGSQAYVARKTTQLSLSTKALDQTPWLRFPARFENYRKQLRELLTKAKQLGYEIALYGAGGRSASVVNLCKVSHLIDFVVDDRKDLHHLIFPGTDKAVINYEEIMNTYNPNIFYLMGVGADKEHLVLNSLPKHTGHVSLFPQRDTLASMQKVISFLAKQGEVEAA
jgi:2-polyprenyl-3-methyl-5-hydroxy-6-metoxy-1,4-benzoquinol methylase